MESNKITDHRLVHSEKQPCVRTLFVVFLQMMINGLFPRTIKNHENLASLISISKWEQKTTCDRDMGSNEWLLHSSSLWNMDRTLQCIVSVFFIQRYEKSNRAVKIKHHSHLGRFALFEELEQWSTCDWKWFSAEDKCFIWLNQTAELMTSNTRSVLPTHLHWVILSKYINAQFIHHCILCLSRLLIGSTLKSSHRQGVNIQVNWSLSRRQV